MQHSLRVFDIRIGDVCHLRFEQNEHLLYFTRYQRITQIQLHTAHILVLQRGQSRQNHLIKGFANFTIRET